ncbi:unnamed protein product [Caenorhabditis angaria]|uniref:Uncharacterized protein n=1 Tax=Caenorhabditis angaria TaxID=860376 RepID=A0A9P1IRZ3_9PELO|nr:unnamed protein product [Caenorhabditis angaria]
MGLSFGSVFYCGITTHLNIRRHKKIGGVSDRTRDLQTQLFRALVLQTVIPMIFMYIPITLLFIVPFFKWDVGSWANVTTSSVHLYPGIDPMVLLFLIKDYRRTIFRFFSRKKLGKVDGSTSMVKSRLSIT